MSHQVFASSTISEASRLADLIKDRRTIRRFEDHMLSPALLSRLLQEATELTLWEGEQPPFRFLLAAEAEQKSQAAAIIMNAYSEQAVYKWVPGKIRNFMADRIEKIPAIALTIMKKGQNQEVYDQHFALTSAAVHNFSLLLWEQQIGMVWGTGEMLDYPAFKKGLSLQEDEQVHSMVYIGKFAKKPKTKPRTEAAKLLTHLT